MKRLTLPGAPVWHKDALCAQVGGDYWFPAPDDPTTATALKVCGMCPVREACLDEALQIEAGKSRQSRHGIWGGLTPNQRAAADRQAVSA